MPKRPAPSVSGISLSAAAKSWRLNLRARNLSVRTVEQYTESLRLFLDFVGDRELASVTKTHVAEFLADQLARLKPSSALTRYKGLKLFFDWCVTEDELSASPMACMKPPMVPEQPVPVLVGDEVRRLLKACAGKDFEARRDLAILSLLFDTGVRRSELATLTVNDLDLETRHIQVLGKGRRVRVVPFGDSTARALDRWLRIRGTHKLAQSDALWLGTNGRSFGPQGVRQMLERRGEQASVKLHAHLFRHTFAHNHLNNGGNEGDLMMLAGWKSRQMLSRYASSTAAERARTNYKSPLDSL